MKIGILGTGHVAKLLGTAWQQAGHEVTLGSRDPNSKKLDLPVNTLTDTARNADVIVDAIIGTAAVETISSIPPSVFAGKTVIDVTNAFTPEYQLVYPTSSVAEQLQQILPDAHLVKTLNTGAMTVMSNPEAIGSKGSVFLSGDDAAAKADTAGLLTDLGWPADSVVDLGGIDTAGAAEHYFLLFVRLAGALKSEMFNIRVVR